MIEIYGPATGVTWKLRSCTSDRSSSSQLRTGRSAARSEGGSWDIVVTDAIAADMLDATVDFVATCS